MADVISTPLYGFGGFLRGARRAAEESTARQENLGSGLSAWAKGGISGIKRGIQEKTTPGTYLTEDVLKLKSGVIKSASGLATDVLTDPLNFAGAAISQTGRGLSKFTPQMSSLVEKIPGLSKAKDFIGKFQYGYKTPPNFLRRYEALQQDISRAGEYAKSVATPLKYGAGGKELPRTTQRIIGDVLGIVAEGSKKAVTPEEQTLIKKYGPIAGRTLREFGNLAEEQIKLGKDPQIFERLLNKYYGKRLYTSKLAGQQPAIGKAMKLDLSVYKGRKDLPEDVRKALGEIKEPAYGAGLAAYAEKKNIALTKFYRWVAKKFVDQGENLVELPKTENLGTIAGRKVPKQIAEYINQVSNYENGLTQKIVKAFKVGKTVLSPKQLVRNIATSQVQNYLVEPTSILNLPKAVREWKSKGKFYQVLKNTGEIGSTFAGSELKDFAPRELSQFGKRGVLGKAVDMGSGIQQGNEEIAKLQMFISRIKRLAGEVGVTAERALGNRDMVENARAAAELSGFNYQKVSPLVSQLRRGTKLGPLPFSIPFITYPLKAAKLTATTLKEHPERIAGLVKGERAIQGLTSDTAPNEQYLPEYLKEAVRVGRPDRSNRTPYLNLKYLYPHGNLQEISPLPLGLTPDPIYQELVSQGTGRDAFTGKEFGNAPGALGVGGRLRHAAETFGPTPVRSVFKILDTLTKNPSLSTSPNWVEATIQELGLPLYRYNPAEGRKFANFDRREAIKETRNQLLKFRKSYKGKLPDPIYKMIDRYYTEEHLKARRGEKKPF